MYQQSIKGPRATDPLYKMLVLLLSALWLVSGILMVQMFFSWRSKNSNGYEPTGNRHSSVDSMLLSFNDLKLNSKATLINLQLKEVSQPTHTGDTSEQTVAAKRKKIYNRLLEEKTRIPEPVRHEGFMIRQVPQ